MIQGVPINMGIERIESHFGYLMHGKESIKMRLYVLRAFHKVVYRSCVLIIDEDIIDIKTTLIY